LTALDVHGAAIGSEDEHDRRRVDAGVAGCDQTRFIGSTPRQFPSPTASLRKFLGFRVDLETVLAR
jgi:hypothetical protein